MITKMGGYAACKKEFENCIRKITQLGYGLVIIAHSERRVEKTSDDSEIEIMGPAIPRRAYEIVNQLVDIIGYIDATWDDKGQSHRWLYTRKTPRIMAGSRFPYLEPKIEFGYQQLVDAIADAIDKQQERDGTVVVDKAEIKQVDHLDFKVVRERARELWTQLIDKDQENANILAKKIEMIFGHRMKLSEVTEDQVDLLNLVVLDMEEMIKEG